MRTENRERLVRNRISSVLKTLITPTKVLT